MLAAAFLLTNCKKDDVYELNPFCSSLSAPAEDLKSMNVYIYELDAHNVWRNTEIGRSEVVEGCRLRVLRENGRPVFYNLDRLFKYENQSTMNASRLNVYFN